MRLSSQAARLRRLWDERRFRGLMPVLEEMNDLLERGVITAEEFASITGESGSPQARGVPADVKEDRAERWRRRDELARLQADAAKCLQNFYRRMFAPAEVKRRRRRRAAIKESERLRKFMRAVVLVQRFQRRRNQGKALVARLEARARARALRAARMEAARQRKAQDTAARRIQMLARHWVPRSRAAKVLGRFFLSRRAARREEAAVMTLVGHRDRAARVVAAAFQRVAAQRRRRDQQLTRLLKSRDAAARVLQRWWRSSTSTSSPTASPVPVSSSAEAPASVSSFEVPDWVRRQLEERRGSAVPAQFTSAAPVTPDPSFLQQRRAAAALVRQCLELAKQTKAAITLQCWVRRLALRRRLQRRKATITLQCWARRLALQRRLQRRQATIALQCWARRLALQRRVQRRKATIALQCWARRLALQRRLQRRKAAIALQCWTRRLALQRRVQRRKATIALQCWARRLALQRRLQRRKAAIALQCWTRRLALQRRLQRRTKKRAKKEKKARKRAAIVLQRWFRRSRAKPLPAIRSASLALPQELLDDDWRRPQPQDHELPLRRASMPALGALGGTFAGAGGAGGTSGSVPVRARKRKQEEPALTEEQQRLVDRIASQCDPERLKQRAGSSSKTAAGKDKPLTRKRRSSLPELASSSHASIADWDPASEFSVRPMKHVQPFRYYGR